MSPSDNALVGTAKKMAVLQAYRYFYQNRALVSEATLKKFLEDYVKVYASCYLLAPQLQKWMQNQDPAVLDGLAVSSGFALADVVMRRPMHWNTIAVAGVSAYVGSMW